jgi:hypothetical protein
MMVVTLRSNHVVDQPQTQGDHYLYVLIRKDMTSLNHAGKMGAQIAHAANFAAYSIGNNDYGSSNRNAWLQWEKSTPQGFGTTIVLGGTITLHRGKAIRDGLTIDQIRDLTIRLRALGFATGIVNDPTYPMLDGKVMHGFPCDTCAFIFGSKAALEPHLKLLILHPESADPVSDDYGPNLSVKP